MLIQKHYVVFYSPGTFVNEVTTKEIDSWDVDKAVEIAKSITERYNAVPYAFRFITRGRRADELDSREIDKSNRYFLGGTVHTLDEIKAENNPDNRVLISNMIGNDIEKVVINDNSWRCTQALEKDDVILDVKIGRCAEAEAS